MRGNHGKVVGIERDQFELGRHRVHLSFARILPQISPRNLRKLDAKQNRYPSPEHFRGHAFAESALPLNR
jgi:hypothetical protein